MIRIDDPFHLAFKHLPYATMIFDSELNCIVANDVARQLNQTHESSWTKHGDLIGCTFNANCDEDCGNTEYCKHCPLRSCIGKALTTDQDHVQKIIEMVCDVDGLPVTKIFELDCKRITLGKRDMVVTSLNEISRKEFKEQELLYENRLLKELLEQSQKKGA